MSRRLAQAPVMASQPLESASSAAPRYGAGDLVAGKYRLDRLLGEGGMGSVWLAYNVYLDAPVAIKLVRANLAWPEAADRLRLEARVEARLEHPAIVRVFDCGETDQGDPFIAMEHLEGMTFADALDRGPVSATTAVQTLLPVIDGLSVAHARGIVHRDVKPENVFLARGTRHIQPKILDFGVAKFDRLDPEPGLTRQGEVIGSPSYMAPEQARGLSNVDHRVDVWAACAVLYEAMMGHPPFRGDGYNAILRAIIEETPAPLTRVDPALWTIVERGLAKSPSARFQTIRELGNALAQYLVDRGVTQDICGDSLARSWDVRAGTSELAVGSGDTTESRISIPPMTAPVPGSPKRRRGDQRGAAASLVVALALVIVSATVAWSRSDARASAVVGDRAHVEVGTAVVPAPASAPRPSTRVEPVPRPADVTQATAAVSRVVPAKEPRPATLGMPLPAAPTRPSVAAATPRSPAPSGNARRRQARPFAVMDDTALGLKAPYPDP